MRESDSAAISAQVRDDDETFEVQQLKAMQQPNWNEGRLDDLNKKVDDGIGRLDKEHRELRGEIKAGFDRMDVRFEQMDAKFDAKLNRMDAKFDAKFNRMDAKFDAKFDRMDAKFDAKFDRLTWSLLGAVLAIVLAVIGAPHL